VPPRLTLFLPSRGTFVVSDDSVDVSGRVRQVLNKSNGGRHWREFSQWRLCWLEFLQYGCGDGFRGTCAGIDNQVGITHV
jgi:hypothetical protein